MILGMQKDVPAASTSLASILAARAKVQATCQLRPTGGKLWQTHRQQTMGSSVEDGWLRAMLGPNGNQGAMPHYLINATLCQ